MEFIVVNVFFVDGSLRLAGPMDTKKYSETVR